MEKASGLEVDACQGALHSPYVASHEPKFMVAEPDAGGAGFGTGTYKEPMARRPRTILGLRRTTFALSTALLVVLILGIVSAVGAGTCASKNGGFTGSNPPSANVNLAGCQTANSTASPTPSNTNSTSTFLPTSNCTSLGSQYASALSRAQYSIHCSTDFAGNDLLGVFLYKFEDCIEACANFNAGALRNVANTQCSGVSYTTNTTAFPAYSGMGNCFLKNGTTAGTQKVETDSASLVTS